MSSDMNIDHHELLGQLMSSSQFDNDSNVGSIPAQNLQQLESFLGDKGIRLPSDPNASDQQRLGNVMNGLEKAGYQVSQATSASGAAVYSISLTPNSKVSISTPITDDLETTAPTQAGKADQTVTAQLAGSPAAPAAASANPYLNVGTAAKLRNIMEDLFSKQSQITQLLGDAGIQEIKNLQANTQSKMQAIGDEYRGENLKEQANINYNATMMAVTGTSAIAGLAVAGKAALSENQRGDGKDSFGKTGKSAESLTLTPEGEQSSSSAATKTQSFNSDKWNRVIDSAKSIGQSMASIQQSSTNMVANTDIAQAKQAQASLDLNQTMINRNLDTYGKQQQNVHQDALKTLDLITQFSKTAVDMTRSTFSQA